MCANKRFLLYLLFVSLLVSMAGVLRAEEPSPWYLITESELRSIEIYREASEQEKQTWLSQVRELRTRAENSETRSAKLEAESGSLNRQLTQAREERRKLEQSFNEFEAEQSALLSLKNGEITSLIQEKADKTTQAEKYKGKAETRLVMIIALAGAWALFIGIKVCRFFRILPF